MACSRKRGKIKLSKLYSFTCGKASLLAPTPAFWLVTLFVSITTLIPYFTFSAIKAKFVPMYHQRIQQIRKGLRPAAPKTEAGIEDL